MHLEHLNLVVHHLDKTLDFYQAAFPHWHVRGQGTQNWYGTQRRWLHFGDDYQYLAFCDNGTGDNRALDTNNLGLSHFAYVTHSLDATTTRLAAAGYTPSKNGNNTLSRKNIYFTDPNGFEIEFVEYLSDIPSDRNDYE